MICKMRKHGVTNHPSPGMPTAWSHQCPGGTGASSPARVTVLPRVAETPISPLPPSPGSTCFSGMAASKKKQRWKKKAALALAAKVAKSAAQPTNVSPPRPKGTRVVPPRGLGHTPSPSKRVKVAWASPSDGSPGAGPGLACVHGICGGAGNCRRRLPVGPDRDRCLKIMKRSDEFIADNVGTELRVCVERLKNDQLDVSSSNLLALEQDLVHLGFVGTRSKAGTALHNKKTVRRSTKTAATASGAAPPGETEDQETIRLPRQRNAELELEVKEAGDVLTDLKKKPRLHSFDWMMERPTRVQACTPLNKNQLLANVELLEAAGAAGAHAAISVPKPLLGFRDACTMAIVRLCRARPCIFVAECVGLVSKGGGAQKDSLWTCLLAAQETAVYISERTTFRPLDF